MLDPSEAQSAIGHRSTHPCLLARPPLKLEGREYSGPDTLVFNELGCALKLEGRGYSGPNTPVFNELG